MALSTQELEDMLANAGYARFLHTNLHMHTPATPWDWNAYEGQTRRAGSITPDQYFEALNQTSLDLVAIVDHNCVEWCQPLMELAKAGRRKGLSHLHVLPGVEITTYEGPHLLGIFDEGTAGDDIRDMLKRLGMSGLGKEDDRVSCRSNGSQNTITDVFAEITRLGGVVVGPHVHNKDGLWGSKQFKGRNAVLDDPRLRILAAPSGQVKRVRDANSGVRLLCKNMDSSKTANSFAFINVSDCHRIEDMEADTTWLKMSYPSLEGVRQIIFEPELRVAHELVDSGEAVENPVSFHFAAPSEALHPCLFGLAVTVGPAGGLLDGHKVAFSPHQNCIIGRNYAGKSAVMDCLRFALGADPQNEDALARHVDRLRAFVGDGGQVRVYLRGLDERTYGVSRTFSCSKVGSGKAARCRLEGRPEVSLLWGEEFHRESQLDVEDIFHIEAYPQGEVVRIKSSASQQMTIVDTLAHVQETLKRLSVDELDTQRTLRGRLKDNSAAIVDCVAKRSTLAGEIAGISDLQDEIRKLEELSDSPLLVEIKQWGEVEARIGQYTNRLARVEGDLTKLEWPTREDTAAGGDDSPEQSLDAGQPAFDPSGAPASGFLAEAERQFGLALGAASQAVSGGLAHVQGAIDSLKQLCQASTNRFEAARSGLTQSISSEKDDLQAGLVERLTEKRQALNALQEKQTELGVVEQRMHQLEGERRGLLAQYQQEWAQIREERRKIVALINANAADNIRAELSESADSGEYQKLLDALADRLTSAANRIQNRQEQLACIASSVTPQQLVELVRAGDANQLMAAAPGVTANTARVLLSMGTADLHELEVCTLHDRFVILFRKEGDGAFTPIDGGLSGGEQALALISVAMIPKELPLLIDQPEDELGPGLITSELVEQIRRVKPHRQLIFVTHVPNIPVLADCEQVIYVEQEIHDGIRISRIKHCGSMENESIVSKLLELDGGKLAFQKRSERYAVVIGSHPV